MDFLKAPSEHLDDIDLTSVGTIGEHIVTAYLMKHGYKCHRTDYGSFDIIMYGHTLPKNTYIRIDVKTSRYKGLGKYFIGKGARTNERRECSGDNGIDLFAFVDLESNTLHFKHYSELEGKQNHTMSHNVVLCTAESLASALKICLYDHP